MKLSLKDILVRYMASHNEWRSKYHICQEMNWKYQEKGQMKTAMADTISRKLRECEEESRLARKDDGKSCQYKFLPPDKRSMYIPWSIRPEGQKNNLFKV